MNTEDNYKEIADELYDALQEAHLDLRTITSFLIEGKTPNATWIEGLVEGRDKSLATLTKHIQFYKKPIEN